MSKLIGLCNEVEVDPLYSFSGHTKSFVNYNINRSSNKYKFTSQLAIQGPSVRTRKKCGCGSKPRKPLEKEVKIGGKWMNSSTPEWLAIGYATHGHVFVRVARSKSRRFVRSLAGTHMSSSTPEDGQFGPSMLGTSLENSLVRHAMRNGMTLRNHPTGGFLGDRSLGSFQFAFPTYRTSKKRVGGSSSLKLWTPQNGAQWFSLLASRQKHKAKQATFKAQK